MLLQSPRHAWPIFSWASHCSISVTCAAHCCWCTCKWVSLHTLLRTTAAPTNRAAFLFPSTLVASTSQQSAVHADRRNKEVDANEVVDFALGGFYRRSEEATRGVSVCVRGFVGVQSNLPWGEPTGKLRVVSWGSLWHKVGWLRQEPLLLADEQTGHWQVCCRPFMRATRVSRRTAPTSTSNLLHSTTCTTSMVQVTTRKIYLPLSYPSFYLFFSHYLLVAYSNLSNITD